MNAKTKEKLEAIEELKKHIKPGDTIYTVLKHCSKSGTYRVIDVYSMENNEPLRWSFSVSKAISARYDRKHEGVGVSGCGMDMGFDIVYNLSWSLFRDGFTCLGEKCLSNDHSNGDRDRTPHHHKEGGYCLSHRWM